MEKQTYKYIDVLQKIVDSYNNTPRQSLGGSTPSSVTKNNEDESRFIQFKSNRLWSSVITFKYCF
jgi:hypothetical protein